MESNDLTIKKVTSLTEGTEEWSKPEVKVIGINEETLGGGASSSNDCSSLSGNCLGPPA